MMLLLKLFLIIIPLFNFTKARDRDQLQYDGTSSVRNQPSNINDEATYNNSPPSSDYTMANSLPVSRNVQVDFPRRTENSVTSSSKKCTRSAATEPDSTLSTSTSTLPTSTASIATAAPNDSSSTATPVTYVTQAPYPQQPYPYPPYYPYYPPSFNYPPPPPPPPPYYSPYYAYPPMNYTPPYFLQTMPIAPTSTEAPSSTMSTTHTSTPTSTTPANDGSTSTSTATSIPSGICPREPASSTSASDSTSTSISSGVCLRDHTSSSPANKSPSTSNSIRPGISPTETESSAPANNVSTTSTTTSTSTSTTATPPARTKSSPVSTPSKTEKPTSDCGKTNSFNSVPNECDTYVECKDGVSKKHYCQDGLVFKPSTKWPDFPCVAPSEYKCTNGSLKQKTVATELCPHRNGYFLKKDSDCSQFVVCTAGKPTIKHCPQGLVFNVEQAACDWPANVPSCKAEAFKDFECPAVEAEDSDTDEIFKYSYKKNCRKYVACQGGHPRLLSCDSGLHFSEEEEMCVDKSKVTDCVEE